MQIHLTFRNNPRNVKRRVLHTRGLAGCYITRTLSEVGYFHVTPPFLHKDRTPHNMQGVFQLLGLLPHQPLRVEIILHQALVGQGNAAGG